WTIPCICNWGGWSLDYNHATILKYLFSWNNNSHEVRKDFFNPMKQTQRSCSHCGCGCGC
ncbi:hypothetical protein L208DRAFT_1053245, partial [Tricholoma matsutake]